MTIIYDHFRLSLIVKKNGSTYHYYQLLSISVIDYHSSISVIVAYLSFQLILIIVNDLIISLEIEIVTRI